MHFFGKLSLAIVGSAAFLGSVPSHAAILTISRDTHNECGRGFIFCNGTQAYSLTEIENGTIQIPVFPILPSQVVIVNDTGQTVTNLQFTYSTMQLFAFNMECEIAPSLRSNLKACGIATSSSGLTHSLFGMVSAQFTFVADNKKGIPDGAYFELTTVGFLPGGFICGGGDGGGTGTGTGTGTGSGGPTGPPQQ